MSAYPPCPFLLASQREAQGLGSQEWRVWVEGVGEGLGWEQELGRGQGPELQGQLAPQAGLPPRLQVLTEACTS